MPIIIDISTRIAFCIFKCQECCCSTTRLNPYGKLPAMPQMSIGRAGTAPSLHYGISSIPVTILPCFEFD
ncbi:hypothetical protein Gotur_025313 [Gossypium turneri]